MSEAPGTHEQGHVDSVLLYALDALPPGEVAGVEAQIAACPECRRELDAVRPIVRTFVAWPTNVLRPSSSLWNRLAERIGLEGAPAARRQPDATWDEPAPGIFVKLLATDRQKQRVSMLVRLAPGVEYPPHRHGGVEELYLLDGELVVNDQLLHPGDYFRGETGAVDYRVWSETGCTCVLLSSLQDLIL
jgi:anti-sigma factor ChrR (cupin superfamily)